MKIPILSSSAHDEAEGIAGFRPALVKNGRRDAWAIGHFRFDYRWNFDRISIIYRRARIRRGVFEGIRHSLFLQFLRASVVTA